MDTINALISMLFLLSFLALIIGILRPKTFGHNMDRKKAIGIFGLSTIGSFLLVAIAANIDKSNRPRAEQSAVSPESETQQPSVSTNSTESQIIYAQIEDVKPKAVRTLVEQQLININSPKMLLVDAKSHLESNRPVAANVLLGTILRKYTASEQASEAKELLISMTLGDRSEVKSTAGKQAAKQQEAQFIDPYDLKVNTTYRLSESTPLMPEYKPKNPMEALKLAKKIAVGNYIQIIGIEDKQGTPWYRVNVLSPEKVKLSDGWINCVALIGQDLSLMK